MSARKDRIAPRTRPHWATPGWPSRGAWLARLSRVSAFGSQTPAERGIVRQVGRLAHGRRS